MFLTGERSNHNFPDFLIGEQIQKSKWICGRSISSRKKKATAASDEYVAIINFLS